LCVEWISVAERSLDIGFNFTRVFVRYSSPPAIEIISTIPQISGVARSLPLTCNWKAPKQQWKLIPSPAQVKLILRPTVSRPVQLGVGSALGPMTRSLSFFIM
jgi:hypothetical protein